MPAKSRKIATPETTITQDEPQWVIYGRTIARAKAVAKKNRLTRIAVEAISNRG